ncbi:hypothetical protein FWY44_13565 [Escherichia coli]|nr:hypothetical protein [Escherichia coli]
MKTNTSDFTITISKNDQALIDNLKYLAEKHNNPGPEPASPSPRHTKNTTNQYKVTRVHLTEGTEF